MRVVGWPCQEAGFCTDRVELFERIRRDRRLEDASVRSLARRYGVNRRVVRQALHSALPPARKAIEVRRSILDQGRAWIDEMLRADLTAAAEAAAHQQADHGPIAGRVRIPGRLQHAERLSASARAAPGADRRDAADRMNGATPDSVGKPPGAWRPPGPGSSFRHADPASPAPPSRMSMVATSSPWT